ncbi:helix-turn-helix domain-containing protein [Rhodococcus hoagii]|nr:helix-turn-helix domain-containing protein [Prescottella equi]
MIQDAAVSLASWRTKKGFTQEEVAAALDMSPSTYSRLERGERPVTNGDTRHPGKPFRDRAGASPILVDARAPTPRRHAPLNLITHAPPT